MRIVGLVCVLLSLIGCNDSAEDAVGDGASSDNGVLYDSGVRDGGALDVGGLFAPRNDIECQVVVEDDGIILPVEDGARVPFVWGLQGGTMIQPGMLLPASAVDGLGSVRLTIRHRADPDHPAAFRDAGDFADVVQDLYLWPYGEGRVLAGPVDLQLGRSDLEGMRLQLTVSVQAPDFEAHKTIRLALENAATPCDEFRHSGAVCQYWSLPLDMRVVEHASQEGCPDAVVPMIEYRADAPDAEQCAGWLGLNEAAGVLPYPGLEGGADPECLESMGFAVGAVVAGHVAVQGKGDCAPVVLQPSQDARECAICE